MGFDDSILASVDWVVVLASVEMRFCLHDCGDFRFADSSVSVDVSPVFGNWDGRVSVIFEYVHEFTRLSMILYVYTNCVMYL